MTQDRVQFDQACDISQVFLAFARTVTEIERSPDFTLQNILETSPDSSLHSSAELCQMIFFFDLGSTNNMWRHRDYEVSLVARLLWSREEPAKYRKHSDHRDAYSRISLGVLSDTSDY